jgi:hypothetical protein
MMAPWFGYEIGYRTRQIRTRNWCSDCRAPSLALFTAMLAVFATLVTSDTEWQGMFGGVAVVLFGGWLYWHGKSQGRTSVGASRKNSDSHSGIYNKSQGPGPQMNPRWRQFAKISLADKSTLQEMLADSRAQPTSPVNIATTVCCPCCTA